MAILCWAAKNSLRGTRHDFSIYWETDVLFQLKIRAASEKFKNQLPVLRIRIRDPGLGAF